MTSTFHLKILLWCILTNLPGSLAKIPPNAERRVMEYLFQSNQYSMDERPVLNASESLEVETSLFMNAILNLNEKQQVLRTASWAAFKWFDPRLTWNPDDFEGVDLINVKLEDVWLPNIYLNNGVEIDAVITPSRGMILLTSEGEINLGTPLIQSTHCPVRVKHFPFDTQVCVLRFNTQNIPVEKVRLTAGVSFLRDDVSSTEWEAFKVNATSDIFEASGIVGNRRELEFSQIRFCIFLRRHSSYYITLLIIPSIVLNIMASMTFLSPPDSGERISLSVSMILGLSVFQLLVADILPVTREDTPVISLYLTGNFLLAIFSIPFSLVSVNIVYDPTAFFRLCNRFQMFPRSLGNLSLVSKAPKETKALKIDKSSIQVIYDDEMLKEKVTMAAETKKQDKEAEKTLSSDRRNEADRKPRCTKGARAIAKVIDRFFLVVFLLAIVSMFLAMVIRLRDADEYIRSGDCSQPEETRRVEFK